MKKWITNKYNLNEDIYEWNNKYYIDFCLREDAQHFIKLCLKHNISFTYDAPYGVGIAKIQLKILIEYVENLYDDPTKIHLEYFSPKLHS